VRLPEKRDGVVKMKKGLDKQLVQIKAEKKRKMK